MNRKILLILVAINLVFISILVFNKASSMPKRTAYSKKVSKGLYTSQVGDAVATLRAESKMWQQFTNMSGRISIEAGKSDAQQKGETLALEGLVSIKRFNSDKGPKYQLMVTNKDNGWCFETDGNRRNTQVHCQDEKTAAAIRAIDPASILSLLVAPKEFLAATLEIDQKKIEQLIGMFAPEPNQAAPKDVPHSYTFTARAADAPVSELSFVNQRLSGWRMKNGVTASLENPIESNNFWFPSKLRFSISSGQQTAECRILLSDLAVNSY